MDLKPISNTLEFVKGALKSAKKALPGLPSLELPVSKASQPVIKDLGYYLSQAKDGMRFAFHSFGQRIAANPTAFVVLGTVVAIAIAYKIATKMMASNEPNPAA